MCKWELGFQIEGNKQIRGAGSGISIGNFTGKSKRGEGKMCVCVCVWENWDSKLKGTNKIRGAGSGMQIGNFMGKPKRGEGKCIFVCVCMRVRELGFQI